MGRTHSGIHWRIVATIVAMGALALLMGWGFLHGHRWLTYLGLLGLLGALRAFEERTPR